jgi:hypothetical protein
MLFKPEWPQPLSTSYDLRTATRAAADWKTVAAGEEPNGVCYIGPDGTNHCVFPYSVLAEFITPDKLPQPNTITAVPDEQWEKFAGRFREVSARPPWLSLISLLVEHHVPICGEKMGKIVTKQDGDPHWASTLADMVYAHDMKKFGALVLVHRSREQKNEQVVLPAWIPHTHLKKTWFGFENIDAAMSVKFSFPQCTMIEL